MVPDKKAKINSCPYLKKECNYGEIKYCKLLAYRDKCPCDDEVKEYCLENHHMTA